MSQLVTGGAGFIGSNYVRHVLDHTDDTVTVLDKLTYAGNRAVARRAPAERFTFVQGDVCDTDARRAPRREHDAVVHFAAESHNDNSLRDPSPFLQTNLIGTFTLLEAVRAHGIARYHHISTDEVYGDLELDDPERFTEATPYNPSSPYSATKAGSDLLVRAWVRSFGVRATISNCSNNYGPYQHVEKFIPRQITNVLDGGRPALRRRAQRARLDPRRRPQCRRATILERGRIGETYLVGADGELDNRQVVEMILDPARPAGRRLRPSSTTAPATICATPSTRSKLRDELGWRARRSDFGEGLAATIGWYPRTRTGGAPQRAPEAGVRRPRASTRCTDAAARHRGRRSARPRCRRGRHGRATTSRRAITPPRRHRSRRRARRRHDVATRRRRALRGVDRRRRL